MKPENEQAMLAVVKAARAYRLLLYTPPFTPAVIDDRRLAGERLDDALANLDRLDP